MNDGAKEFGCSVELKRNNERLQGQVEKLREALAPVRTSRASPPSPVASRPIRGGRGIDAMPRASEVRARS